MWIFREPESSCSRLEIYQESEESTLVLRDGNIHTCIQAFPDNQTYFLAKVLAPTVFYGYTGGATVTVVGEDISCSPAEGMAVSLLPSCDSSHCPSAVRCSSKNGFSRNVSKNHET